MNFDELDDLFQKFNFESNKREAARNLLCETILYFEENSEDFDIIAKDYLGRALIHYQIRFYDCLYYDIEHIFVGREFFNLDSYARTRFKSCVISNYVETFNQIRDNYE